MAVPGRRIKAPGTAFFIMRFSQVHIYDTIINYSYIYRRRILKQIKIDENGIHIVFGITDNDQIKLLHFSHAGFCENDITKKHESLKESEDRQEQFIDEGYQLVQVNVSGYDRPYEKHGNKHISTVPGYLLKYTG
jgi:alpha-galactosidase